MVGSSLEVSKAKPGQRLFSLDGEWAAEAGGSGSRVPFPGRMGLGRRHRAVGAGGRSCWGLYCALKPHVMGVGRSKVWDASNEPAFKAESHLLTAPFRPRELFFPHRNAGFILVSSSTHRSASPHLCQVTVRYSVASVTIARLFLWPRSGGCREDLRRDPFIGPTATCFFWGPP